MLDLCRQDQPQQDVSFANMEGYRDQTGGERGFVNLNEVQSDKPGMKNQHGMRNQQNRAQILKRCRN